MEPVRPVVTPVTAAPVVRAAQRPAMVAPAALVVSVGIFVVLLVFPQKERGTGRFEAGGGRNITRDSPRKAIELAARFTLLVAMLAGAWGLARLSGVLAAGIFGG